MEGVSKRRLSSHKQFILTIEAKAIHLSIQPSSFPPFTSSLPSFQVNAGRGRLARDPSFACLGLFPSGRQFVSACQPPL